MAESLALRGSRVRGLRTAVDAAPPHVYFVGSAVFHYLGPAFAVLLFARVDVLGVAWLRIAAAAAVFALWRRPWRGRRPRAVNADRAPRGDAHERLGGGTRLPRPDRGARRHRRRHLVVRDPV